MPRCKDCGKPFEKDRRSPNQKRCHSCSVHSDFRKGFLAKMDEVKKAADRSGEAKVFLATEHSQKFLRSIVPSLNHNGGR